MKKLAGILTAIAMLVSSTPSQAQLLQYAANGAEKVKVEGDVSLVGNTLTVGAYRKVVNLTAAQLIAMYTTPITLIPAPGAGKTIVLKQVLFRMTRTSTAFTGGGTVVINYTTGPVACINTIAAAQVTGAAGTADTARFAIDAAAVQNDAISITNGSAAFAAGTGTAQVMLWYSIQ